MCLMYFYSIRIYRNGYWKFWTRRWYFLVTQFDLWPGYILFVEPRRWSWIQELGLFGRIIIDSYWSKISVRKIWCRVCCLCWVSILCIDILSVIVDCRRGVRNAGGYLGIRFISGCDTDCLCRSGRNGRRCGAGGRGRVMFVVSYRLARNRCAIMVNWWFRCGRDILYFWSDVMLGSVTRWFGYDIWIGFCVGVEVLGNLPNWFIELITDPKVLFNNGQWPYYLQSGVTAKMLIGSW